MTLERGDKSVKLCFDAVVHARPDREIEEQSLDVGGRKLSVLCIAPEELHLPFPVSFEETLERMDRMPQLLIELDGSFVWSGVEEGSAWQLDGTVNDRDGRLLYVSVRGTCSDQNWERLLHCFGWPTQWLVIQSVREAVFLEEAEFRRWAASDAREI
ncbi:MAG: hypothetical protein RIS70_4283 [Planctomycetota bacterium]|jgi:hypothetical protein